ncbi:hypothetical protein L3V43_10105 [Pseudoalteromonas sp. L23]|uniref:hypothetical protein n=1 Tax=Pseudoalteromonas TaxID=53246 RepID=UPI001EF0810C|nr:MULTISPECIES: hypothetical protein [unclassified Pseudoalteromonas]MCF7514234.1 hypothetical protein [Pseudoalteromonas sp. L7]MCF7526012.1 hypothetical protein [Pseudoalteromonas sp. L23]MCX2769094.1 hypothetical protein [Pseudoalteromonas sp. B530]
MKIIFLMAAFFLFHNLQAAASPEARMILAVDYSKLSDDEIGQVNKLLIEMQPQEEYFEHTVAENENLYSIIQNYTRYSDGASPLSVTQIANAVAKASGVGNLNIIRQGQTLQFPSLPVRPFREGASYNQYQEFNLETKELAICSADGCDPVGLPKTLINNQRRSLADSGALSISVSKIAPREFEKIDVLLSNLGSKATLIPSGYVEIELLQDDFGVSPTIVKSHLPQAPSAGAASLYIVDKFSEDNCAHGNLVEDVVRDTLTKLEAWDELKARVHRLELDFWKDPEKGIKIIRNFIDSKYADFHAKQLFEKELYDIKKDVERGAARDGIPALYLRALLENVEADNGIPVLSASFWVKDQGIRILPRDHRFYERTFIFAATPNLSLEIESASLPEPQGSVYSNRSRSAILVSAFDANLAITSMFSRNGDGIEFIDLGTVTGQFGHCKNRNDHGSSFATPKIAALVFKLANESPRDKVIRRVLLSADIQEKFVNRVQAPGSPRLDLANLDSGLYGIKHNGIIERLSSTSKKHTLTVDQIKQPFGLVSGNTPSIAGVFFGVNDTYVFRESLWRWSQAKVSTFSIVTDIGTIELSELKLKYKGVIAL